MYTKTFYLNLNDSVFGMVFFLNVDVYIFEDNKAMQIYIVVLLPLAKLLTRKVYGAFSEITEHKYFISLFIFFCECVCTDLFIINLA